MGKKSSAENRVKRLSHAINAANSKCNDDSQDKMIAEFIGDIFNDCTPDHPERTLSLVDSALSAVIEHAKYYRKIARGEA